MALITVGPGIGAGDEGYSGAIETWLQKANPANLSGLITQAQIKVWGAMGDCYVGLFYFVAGTTYKCRSAHHVGAIGGGIRTIGPLALAVEAGDLIGAWWENGTSQIFVKKTGGAGVMYTAGDTNLCVVGAEQALATVANWNMDIEGTGAEIEAGGQGSGAANLIQAGLI